MSDRVSLLRLQELYRTYKDCGCSLGPHAACVDTHRALRELINLRCKNVLVPPGIEERSAHETTAPHCKTCDCPQANEPREYTLDYALNIARLWRAGKLIGGDKDSVIAALLTEVERLQSLVEPGRA